MKKNLLLLIAILFSIATYADTIPAGPISGTWTLAGSPYLIMGETTIDSGTTLTIEPGVLVEWQGSYTMHVQGQILAEGTETDSIIFTAANPDTGFRSIRFLDTPAGNDTSKFGYCVFKYGRVYGEYPINCGGAIAASNFGKIIIDHCYFHHNKAEGYDILGHGSGAAIALTTSSPRITNSIFKNNSSTMGGGIMCHLLSNPLIQNNLFTNNSAISLGVYGTGYGGGICCVINAHPEIKNNTFCNNYAGHGGAAIAAVFNCDPTISHNLIFNNTSDGIGGGIELQDTCSPIIINNTIAYNTAAEGGGIDIWEYCDPEITNTILWGNIATDVGNQVNIKDEYSIPDFYYCDIQGGQAAFGGFPHIGEYRFCIDADPLFENTLTGDYHLTENSPCIDTGDPAILDPDSTTSDMGAFYYDQRAITALDAGNLTDTSFVANWQEAQDASGYLLDVANDINFQNFVGDYHNCDVGNALSHLVSGLAPGTDYYYRVRANYYFGRSGYSDTIPATTLVSINDLAKSSVIHLRIHPNPAVRIMNIEYRILNVEVVGLSVFDIHGKEIATLVNETQAAGEYTVRFDASVLPAGIYLIRLQAGNEIVTEKIIKH